MLAKYFKEGEADSGIQAESPQTNDPQKKFAAAMDKEKLNWTALKSRRVVIDGREYRNPYMRRTEHGYKMGSNSEFIREYRADGRLQKWVFCHVY